MTIQEHIHFHLGRFLGKKYRRRYYKSKDNYLWGFVRYLYDMPEYTPGLITRLEDKSPTFDKDLEDWLKNIKPEQDNNEETNQ